MNTTKKLITLLLALLGMTQAVGQESDDYLSIVREGVKWVNEKVIVNHGDTTRYYYTYEFSGKDTDIQYTNMQNDLFDACYYYTGEQLNVEQDSLIAGLLDYYYGYHDHDGFHGTPGQIACMRNHALTKVREDNRQMFDFSYYSDGGSRKLYDFNKNYSTIHYYVNICEFFWCEFTGNEPELTEENFIEVDPVMIEGVECWRYAYLDENGEPLAYVVEGIGFDSRDMGDLLTPFTRQPDHDADYQEWCGLSHVIKDGKIIYKGMNYRPIVPGDVDGDGEVTIGDANSVIDIVVMGGNAGHTRIPEADVNGDGEVNIADVNAIIDMILRHK